MHLPFHPWSFVFLSCLLGGFIWCIASGRSIVPLLLLGTIWNVYIFFGLVWNGTKVLVICALLLVLFRSGVSLWTCKSQVLQLLFFLGLYVVAMTVFGALTVGESDLSDFQPSILQRPPLRGIIASGFWFFGPLCFLIGYKYTPSRSVVDTCIKAILFSSAVAAVVGLVQFVAYYTFPPVERFLAFFCIQASEGAITTVTASNASSWYRPTPFCSEPRHFAFAMALAAATVILLRRFPFRVIPPALTHPIWIAIYLGLCFAAASTSSIAGVAIALPGLLAWLRLQKGQSVFGKSDGLKIGAVLVVTVAIVSMAEIRTGAVSQRFEHYLDAFGLLNRPSEWFQSPDQEDTAAAYLAWLVDSPSALLCGVGPGNGPFYAYNYFSYDTGRSRTTMLLNPRLPIIESLASLGVLGTVLLAVFWWRCWKIPVAPVRSRSAALMSRVSFLRGILAFLLLYMLSNDCTSLVWLMLGMLLRLSTDTQEFAPVEPASYSMGAAELCR